MIEVIIMFRLYFAVIALLLLNIVSRLIFGEIKFKMAAITVFAAFFWPIFLFSKRGRKRLLGKITKL